MSELTITTTQNVNINFNAASVGDRVLGYLIDLVVFIAYFFVVYYLVMDVFGFEKVMGRLDPWSERAIHGIISLPVMFYALWQEVFFEGQTIGKKVMKTKVIKIDGYQASFSDYVIRWMFRIVEVTPPLSFVGLIAMMVNQKTQRLGDIAAGTAIISLKNKITIDHTILKEIHSNYVPVYPLVIKLTDNDMRIIKETYETSLRQADFEMIARLQDKIEKVTGIKSISSNATAFVDTVIADYNYYTSKM